MENIDYFIKDIEAKIKYHRSENEITYAEMLGAFETIKADLLDEMKQLAQDTEDE